VVIYSAKLDAASGLKRIYIARMGGTRPPDFNKEKRPYGRKGYDSNAASPIHREAIQLRM
jgi:hypothetical protein